MFKLPRTRRDAGRVGGCHAESLSLSGVTLTPAFASGTTAYTASVSRGVTQTTISVIAIHSKASVVVTVKGVDAVTDEP